jgi:ribonuclease VapC
MTSVVFDASAVLALIRDEPGAEKVISYIGQAAISAVNLQEIIKEMLLSGMDDLTVRELLGELRLDVRPHDIEAAYAAAGLHAQTREFGRGLGDRSCLALAMQLGVPALTADREWKKVRVKNLRVEHIR